MGSARTIVSGSIEVHLMVLSEPVIDEINIICEDISDELYKAVSEIENKRLSDDEAVDVLDNCMANYMSNHNTKKDYYYTYYDGADKFIIDADFDPEDYEDDEYLYKVMRAYLDSVPDFIMQMVYSGALVIEFWRVIIDMFKPGEPFLCLNSDQGFGYYLK